MPFIQLEGGKIDKHQKEKLISKFTRIASETLGIAEDDIAFSLYLLNIH